MIGHHAPGEDAHGYASLHLREHALECKVVAVTLEDAAFTVGSIQDVVHEAAGRCSQGPWHDSWNARTAEMVDEEI